MPYFSKEYNYDQYVALRRIKQDASNLDLENDLVQEEQKRTLLSKLAKIKNSKAKTLQIRKGLSSGSQKLTLRNLNGTIEKVIKSIDTYLEKHEGKYENHSERGMTVGSQLEFNFSYPPPKTMLDNGISHSERAKNYFRNRS